jgi:hypothetical protein
MWLVMHESTAAFCQMPFLYECALLRFRSGWLSFQSHGSFDAFFVCLVLCLTVSSFCCELCSVLGASCRPAQFSVSKLIICSSANHTLQPLPATASAAAVRRLRRTSRASSRPFAERRP